MQNKTASICVSSLSLLLLLLVMSLSQTPLQNKSIPASLSREKGFRFVPRLHSLELKLHKQTRYNAGQTTRNKSNTSAERAYFEGHIVHTHICMAELPPAPYLPSPRYAIPWYIHEHTAALTRSRAQPKPPSEASHVSDPAGGSPRNATMLRMPCS